MSSKYDYRKIPKQRTQTKKEREKNERIFNIIVFVVSLIIVLYVFYVTIYVAGDHEHIITVTEKEVDSIYRYDAPDKDVYYIYGINEKGKEGKYEVGSNWVLGRDLYVNSELYDEIQKGYTYRVRATGLCWGLEAEPLLNPIVIENREAQVNDIKTPVPIVGILSLIYVCVSSVLFVIFCIRKPEFFREAFKYEDVEYPSQYNSKHMRIVYEYGMPILKREKITIKCVALLFVFFLLIAGPKIIIDGLANWYFANF